MNRESVVTRKTNETDIEIRIDLDGSGSFQGSSGIPFFDHLLTQLARHGSLDLEIAVEGDLAVDNHHTVEDIGICLGQAFRQALGDKRGIYRYGSALVPMDEALIEAALDVSGRPHLSCNIIFSSPIIGDLETELVEEFLKSFTNHGGITLHVVQKSGRNSHHLAEALFKALGRSLRQAVAKDPLLQDIPSTKGILE